MHREEPDAPRSGSDQAAAMVFRGTDDAYEVAPEPPEHCGQCHRAAGRPGWEGLLLCFSESGGQAQGCGDALTSGWPSSGQGSGYGQAATWAGRLCWLRELGRLLTSPYPIYVPFLREELVLEAAWKPVEPSSRSLGSRWLNANPRSSRAFLSQGRARLLQHRGLLSPHTRKLHPKPLKPRRPARGGHEALRASSPRPHPVWSLDHILTF